MVTSSSTASPVAVGSPNWTATSDQFIDLVCADEELLAAEFDAIVAEWEGPPPSREATVCTATTPPKSSGTAQIDECFAPTVRLATSREREGRQRSPPATARGCCSVGGPGECR
jgi:hypothetical protein